MRLLGDGRGQGRGHVKSYSCWVAFFSGRLDTWNDGWLSLRILHGNIWYQLTSFPDLVAGVNARAEVDL